MTLETSEVHSIHSLLLPLRSFTAFSGPNLYFPPDRPIFSRSCLWETWWRSVGSRPMCPRPGEEQSLVIDHEFKHRTWDNDRNGQNILRISVDHSFGLADDADGDIRIDCGVFFPTEAVVKSWPQQPGSLAAASPGSRRCGPAVGGLHEHFPGANWTSEDRSDEGGQAGRRGLKLGLTCLA